MRREKILQNLKKRYDIVVIGGGITGAGVLHEASKMGLSCLLIEQKDFAFGTSSRSAKLVHGGLRYLKNGQIMTTLNSISERERMLNYYKTLVKPIQFLVPVKTKSFRALMKVGLSLYDIMAWRYSHQYYNPQNFSMLIPSMGENFENGGYSFLDAITDDAELVLKVIREGVNEGGTAVNYMQFKEVVREKKRVTGIIAKDTLSEKTYKIDAGFVINATGIFADKIHNKVGKSEKLRSLRGSHLIFPNWRFPVSQAISIMHPRDDRPLYILPWKGHTLVGTTDIDHNSSLDEEPAITPLEGEYMLEALNHWFSDLDLSKEDVLSTFSGVRSVVDSGKEDPSKESREHAVWKEDGFISVTGGKLTTFSLIAKNVLKEAGLSTKKDYKDKEIDMIQENVAEDNVTDPLIEEAEDGMIMSLDDLLLRRTRIGLFSKDGYISKLPELKTKIQKILGWDDKKWNLEEKKYISIWNKAYSSKLLYNLFDN